MASAIAVPSSSRNMARAGANSWYRCVLTEGKNREIRKLMEHFGCVVNRLIRVQYGPFMLEDMAIGAIREVPPAQVKEFVDYLEKKGARL
jgi:23S rRNA pseudouridine2605 synthase